LSDLTCGDCSPDDDVTVLLACLYLSRVYQLVGRGLIYVILNIHLASHFMLVLSHLTFER